MIRLDLLMDGARRRIRSNIGLIVAIIIFFSVSFVLFRTILLSQGEVLYLDIGFSLDPASALRVLHSTLYVWDSTLGRPDAPINWIFATSIISGLAAIFGNMALVSKILYVTVPALAGLMMYLAIRLHIRSQIGGIVAGLIYMTNPWFLSHYLFGHFWVMLSVALLPMAISLSILTWQKGSIRNVLLTAGFLVLVAAFDQRNLYVYIVMVAVFVLSMIFFDMLGSQDKVSTLVGILKKKILPQGMIVAVFLGLSAFWILPLNTVLTGMNPYYPSVESLQNFGTPIEQVIVPTYPGWFDQILGNEYLTWLGILLVLYSVILISVILVRSKKILALSFVMMIGIFLSKGIRYPFGDVYNAFFSYIPFFNAFRNSTHFIPVVVIPMCFIAAYVCSKVDLKCIRWKSFLKATWKKKAGVVCILAFISIILVQAYPIVAEHDLESVSYVPTWSPNTVTPPSSYTGIIQYLSEQKGDYRYMVFPPGIGLTYPWATSEISDPLLNSDVKPVLSPLYVSEDTYMNDMTWWLYQMIYNNRTDMIGPLLGAEGVKWVVLTDGTAESWVNDSLRGFAYNVTSMIQQSSDFAMVYHEGPYYVYEDHYALPLVSQSSYLDLICGDRRLVASMLDSPGHNLTDLSTPAFPVSTLTEAQQDELFKMCHYVVVQGNDFGDLAMTYLQDKWVDPTQFLTNTEDPYENWVYDAYTVVSASGELCSEYGHFAVTYNGTDQLLNVKDTVSTGGEKELWVRMLLADEDKPLNIMIDGVPVAQVNPSHTNNSTIIGLAGFQWVKLYAGNLTAGEHTVSFRSQGYNAISQIAFLDPGEYQAAMQKADAMINGSGAAYEVLIEAEQMSMPNDDGFRDHIANASNGQYALLYSSDFLESSFHVPKTADYRMEVRMESDYGGTLSVYVNGSLVTSAVYQGGASFSNLSLGSVPIGQGDVKLELKSTHNIFVDVISISSGTISSGGDNSSNLTSIRNDPTDVSVTGLGKNDSIVIFRDSYHDQWEMTVGSGKINSLADSTSSNAFILEANNGTSASIHYRPQAVLELGQMISIITVLAIIAVCAMVWIWPRLRKMRKERS